MTLDPKAKISKIIRRLKRLKKKPMASVEFFKKWKEARNELYKTPEYQNFLREVRIRAMYLCQRGCGKKGRHVHHKIRVYDNPDLVVDPKNGEFLCVACHNKEHKNEATKRKVA
jgi:5-methylcytosine-specific restriction endonuclease McrA